MNKHLKPPHYNGNNVKCDKTVENAGFVANDTVPVCDTRDGGDTISM